MSVFLSVKPPPGRGAAMPLAAFSPTTAFVSAALKNDIYRFSAPEIRDTRIYLGEGATSTVYKTRVDPSGGRVSAQAAAVKQKKRCGSSFDQDSSLESWLHTCFLDLRIMSHWGLADARHVTTLLGYFWEEAEISGQSWLSPCLVLPASAEETTSLDEFFKKVNKSETQVSADYLLNICSQVATGLAELHRCDIVHGDLKLGNILLFGETDAQGGNLRAKIADFSHSVILSDFLRPSDPGPPPYTGTRPFLIPEVRELDKQSTGKDDGITGSKSIPLDEYQACDIYGLGILMTDILHRGDLLQARMHRHFSQLAGPANTAGALRAEPEDIVIDRILKDPGKLLDFCKGPDLAVLDIGTYATPEIVRCLDLCLQDDPKQRTTAFEVAQVASGLLPRGSNHTEIIEISATKDPVHSVYYSFMEVRNISLPQSSSIREESATKGNIQAQFAYLLSRLYPPQLSDRIRHQILTEAQHNAKSHSPDVEEFLACCAALGFAMPYDPELVVHHLRKAADLGAWNSLMIFNRISAVLATPQEPCEPTVNSPPYMRDALLGASNGRSHQFVDRVRQLKIPGGYRGSVRILGIGRREGGRRYRHALTIATEAAVGQEWTQNWSLLNDTGHSQSSGTSRLRNQTVELTQSYPVLSVEAAMRATYEVDVSLETTLSSLKESAAMLNMPPGNGTLFHAAATFMGMDSTFLAQRRCLQCFRAIVDAFGSTGLNDRNKLGETPLLVACKNGQRLAVQYLLRQGADASMVDNEAVGPLHWLGFLEDDDIEPVISMLIKAGAGLDVQTTMPLQIDEHSLYFPKGSTPLHFAVGMRNHVAVRALLEHGANPFVEVEYRVGMDQYFLTPLHYAISMLFHEIVAELIQLPNTQQTVTFWPTSRKEPIKISIVHLVSLRVTFPCDTAPFGLWIIHGLDQKLALKKTLDSILAVFPDREVLLVLTHNITMCSSPARSPWILQTLIEEGFGPRKLQAGELDHESEQGGLPSTDWAFQLLTHGAVNAVGHTEEEQNLRLILDHRERFGTTWDEEFFYRVVKHCVEKDKHGFLRLMVQTYKPQSWDEFSVILFNLAAQFDSIGAMEVIWQNSNSPTVLLGNQSVKETALHVAAHHNSVRAIRFLLDNGADIDLEIEKHGTALNLAATTFLNKEATTLLLERGASIYCSKQSGLGHTVLHRAVSDADIIFKGHQQFSLVQILLETFPDMLVEDKVLNSTDKFGQTVLQTAVGKLDLATVNALLSLGVDLDLDHADVLGFTALMRAIFQAHFGWNMRDLFAMDRDETGSGALLGAEGEDLLLRKNLDENINQEMTDLLISAGATEPDRDASTFEYTFLLSCAARMVFSAMSKEVDDITSVVRKAFSRFNFINFAATMGEGTEVEVSWNRSARAVAVYPMGRGHGGGLVFEEQPPMPGTDIFAGQAVGGPREQPIQGEWETVCFVEDRWETCTPS